MTASAHSDLIAYHRFLQTEVVEAIQRELQLTSIPSVPVDNSWSPFMRWLEEQGKTNDKSANTAGFLNTFTSRLAQNLEQANRATAQRQAEANISKIVKNAELASALFKLKAGPQALPWSAETPTHLQQIKSPSPAVRLGTFKPALPGLENVAANLQVPAILSVAAHHAVAFEIRDIAMKPQVSQAVKMAALRLVLAQSPENVELTLVDPFRTSQTDPFWTALADVVCENGIDVRARLSIIQRQLMQRGESGSARLHILIFTGVPRDFDLVALGEILAQIGKSVFTMIVLTDATSATRDESVLDKYISDCAVFEAEDGKVFCKRAPYSSFTLVLDSLPGASELQQVLEPLSLARKARQSSSVEFSDLGVARGGGDSTNGLTVILGKDAHGESLQFVLGADLSQNVLIVGPPGSGKTNLLNVIITGLAVRYPADELQFLLVDFKGGVSFKPYVRFGLPHCSVAAIDCDPEYGFSVLEHLENELEKRMATFLALDESEFKDFRKRQKLPRIVAVIDEFQDLFPEGTNTAERAKQILDYLLRKGRAFGIHLILGTQSIGGPNMARSSSLELIPVRIEMSRSTPGAALGKSSGGVKPGTGVFNMQNGTKEEDKPFQAPYLHKERLAEILKTLSSKTAMQAHVFAGNESPRLTDCKPLMERCRNGVADECSDGALLWLGDPIRIAPPVEIRFEAQRGRHLLAITENQDAGLSILLNSLSQLLAQHRPGTARFSVFNFLKAGSAFGSVLDPLAKKFWKHQLDICDLTSSFTQIPALDAELKERQRSSSSRFAPWYVFLVGFQNARELRIRDYADENPDHPVSQAFKRLIAEGPERSIHLLAWCDRLVNAERHLKGLRDEFCVRIAGRMNRDDSISFLKADAATRLQKPNRLVLQDSNDPGRLTVFRPYKEVDADFLQSFPSN